MAANQMLRRVVITGIGSISPYGPGKDAYWQSIQAGISGVSPITRFDVSDLPVRIAGEVRNFNADDFIPPKDRSTFPPPSRTESPEPV